MSSDNRLPLPAGWASAWPTAGLDPSRAPRGRVDALDAGFADAWPGDDPLFVATPADLIEATTQELVRVAKRIEDGTVGTDDACSLRQLAEVLTLPPSILARLDEGGSDHDEEG